jgi:hypothetical protein
MRRLCRSAEVEESFKDSKKSSGGTTLLYAQTKLRVEEFAEEKRRQRLRPLRNGNSSKSGKKVQKLRREQQQPSDRLGIRSGPLVFTSRRSSGGVHRGGDREPSDLTQIPVSHWIGRDAQSLASGVSAQEKGSESSDLEKMSRYPSAIR